MNPSNNQVPKNLIDETSEDNSLTTKSFEDYFKDLNDKKKEEKELTPITSEIFSTLKTEGKAGDYFEELSKKTWEDFTPAEKIAYSKVFDDIKENKIKDLSSEERKKFEKLRDIMGERLFTTDESREYFEISEKIKVENPENFNPEYKKDFLKIKEKEEELEKKKAEKWKFVKNILEKTKEATSRVFESIKRNPRADKTDITEAEIVEKETIKKLDFAEENLNKKIEILDSKKIENIVPLPLSKEEDMKDERFTFSNIIPDIEENVIVTEDVKKIDFENETSFEGKKPSFLKDEKSVDGIKSKKEEEREGKESFRVNSFGNLSELNSILKLKTDSSGPIEENGRKFTYQELTGKLAILDNFIKNAKPGDMLPADFAIKARSFPEAGGVRAELLKYIESKGISFPPEIPAQKIEDTTSTEKEKIVSNVVQPIIDSVPKKEEEGLPLREGSVAPVAISQKSTALPSIKKNVEGVEIKATEEKKKERKSVPFEEEDGFKTPEEVFAFLADSTDDVSKEWEKKTKEQESKQREWFAGQYDKRKARWGKLMSGFTPAQQAEFARETKAIRNEYHFDDWDSKTIEERKRLNAERNQKLKQAFLNHGFAPKKKEKDAEEPSPDNPWDWVNASKPREFNVQNAELRGISQELYKDGGVEGTYSAEGESSEAVDALRTEIAFLEAQAKEPGYISRRENIEGQILSKEKQLKKMEAHRRLRTAIERYRNEIRELEQQANTPGYVGNRKSIEEKILRREEEIRKLEREMLDEVDAEETSVGKVVEKEEIKEIKDASSWEELMAVLDAKGKIQGSQQEYAPLALKEIIKKVRNKELDISYVTRADGLRDKVSELLEGKSENIFDGATSFDEIYARLDTIEGLQGSQKWYSREELKDNISLVWEGKESPSIITNAGGLWDAFKPILEKKWRSEGKFPEKASTVKEVEEIKLNEVPLIVPEVAKVEVEKPVEEISTKSFSDYFNEVKDEASGVPNIPKTPVPPKVKEGGVSSSEGTPNLPESEREIKMTAVEKVNGAWVLGLIPTDAIPKDTVEYEKFLKNVDLTRFSEEALKKASELFDAEYNFKNNYHGILENAKSGGVARDKVPGYEGLWDETRMRLLELNVLLERDERKKAEEAFPDNPTAVAEALGNMNEGGFRHWLTWGLNRSVLGRRSREMQKALEVSYPEKKAGWFKGFPGIKWWGSQPAWKRRLIGAFVAGGAVAGFGLVGGATLAGAGAFGAVRMLRALSGGVAGTALQGLSEKALLNPMKKRDDKKITEAIASEYAGSSGDYWKLVVGKHYHHLASKNIQMMELMTQKYNTMKTKMAKKENYWRFASMITTGFAGGAGGGVIFDSLISGGVDTITQTVPNTVKVTPSEFPTAVQGDDVWKLLDKNLQTKMSGFSNLPKVQQDYIIDYYKDVVVARPQAYGLLDANHIKPGYGRGLSALFEGPNKVPMDKVLEASSKVVGR